jgi:hypothetical protein
VFRRKKKTTLNDVHVSARLAASHAAGCHSLLNTILTRLGQVDARLAQLADHVGQVDAHKAAGGNGGPS